MIGKSLIVFTCLFVAFNIVAHYNVPNTKYADSDIQTNLINADRYIYSRQNYKAVILGSSLANKMRVDMLPGFYNLALSGMSVYDGGAVLLSSNTLPETVYIELNVIQRPENENFTGEFTSPVYSWLKTTLPALRPENQPVILAKKAIDDIEQLLQPVPAHKPANNKKTVVKNYYLPQSLFRPLLNIQLKSYSEHDTVLINQSVIQLKQLVAKVESRGSKVVFFEMPINPALEQLPKTVLIRNTVKQAFPNYRFIDLPQTTFKTRDGLHLAQKEAIDYTAYFKEKIEED